jgi:hypothetical protein
MNTSGVVRPRHSDIKHWGLPLRCVRDTTPPSTLILDVSLENLTTGLVDRSPAQQAMAGGTTGVSVYHEGGLRLNLSSGATPKWTFNRPIANLRIEFEVKNFSRDRGHGMILSFSRAPEQDHIPRIFLSVFRRDEIQLLFNDMRRAPSVPLNTWTRIRVEIGDPTNGQVDIRWYFDDVLQFSGNSNMVSGATPINYSNYVFPHITLGQDFGHALHDRADAVIRNLKIWSTKP